MRWKYISGRIFGLLKSCLINHVMKFIWNGHASRLFPINTVVPKGFMPGSTLDLSFTNDLPNVIRSQLFTLVLLAKPTVPTNYNWQLFLKMAPV